MVDWLLEDPDAFFHPAILWKRLGPGGTTGPYAFHVTEDVPKGTPLIVLPRKYILESGKPATPGMDYNNDPILCITVEKMIEEYDKVRDSKIKTSDDSEGSVSSSSSFYEPYLSYLFDETVGGTSRGLLPTRWSEPSQDLLDLILDFDESDGTYSLEPWGFEFDFFGTLCPDNESFKFALLEDEDEDDDEEEDAMKWTEAQLAEGRTILEAQDSFLFLLSRGWNDKLLPVVDMLNHRNGAWRNTDVTPLDDGGDDVAAYAWRDIVAGEQLQYSYSECMDATCDFGAIKYGFSTQLIFKDYGFMELYPRRWALDDTDDDDGQGLTAEVTTDENDDTKLVLRWIFETPNERTVKWITKQLARLKSIESEVQKTVDGLKNSVYKDGNLDHERETIVEFYEGYIEFLELALKHKDDPVFLTTEEFEEHLRELNRTERQLSIHDIRKHELLSSPSTSTTRMQKQEEASTDNGKTDDEL